MNTIDTKMAHSNPPQLDIENGTAPRSGEFMRDSEKLVLPEENNEEQGEYGNLVRYISNYKDGRRQSTVAGDDDDLPKAHWWSKKRGPVGADFETPDDWLITDMKLGLTTQEVESRRKRTGWNELTTESTNLFVQFLSYFQGPILYGWYPLLNPESSPIDVSN